MIIPNKPSWTIDGFIFDFKKTMDLCVQVANEINDKLDVQAYAVVGIHPAELSKLLSYGNDFETAKNLIKDGLDYAQHLVLENKAIAIGEIGRPHYPVSDDEWELHNELLLYALELAKEADCPVQLHTESALEEQFKEFANMAKSVHISTYKIIKHFSGPLTDFNENHGLTPSLISTRDVLRDGLKKNNLFLMETDYMDDLTRPGAVLGPKTVPRRTFEFLEKEILSVEDAYQIHDFTVKKVYDI